MGSIFIEYYRALYCNSSQFGDFTKFIDTSDRRACYPLIGCQSKATIDVWNVIWRLVWCVCIVQANHMSRVITWTDDIGSDYKVWKVVKEGKVYYLPLNTD